jgi:hypothetical protein
VSKLGQFTISHVRLDWPAYGQMMGEVSTQSGVVPPGLTTLVVGDLSFVVTVLPGREGTDGPEAWRCIILTGAGWMTKLTALHADYGGTLPVRRSAVLAHLAADCGEPIAQPTDGIIGSTWSRPISSPGLPFRGRDALSLLCARGKTAPWYVDVDGVTRWGVRPATVIQASKARVLDRNLSAGFRRLSIDSPATFTPGRVFEGVTIARTVIVEDAGSLTCELWQS